MIRNNVVEFKTVTVEKQGLTDKQMNSKMMEKAKIIIDETNVTIADMLEQEYALEDIIEYQERKLNQLKQLKRQYF